MSSATTDTARSSRVSLGRTPPRAQSILTLLSLGLISAVSLLVGLAALQSQLDLLGANQRCLEVLVALPDQVQRSLRVTLALCVPAGGSVAVLSLAGILLRIRPEAIQGQPEGMWWRRPGHLQAQVFPWSMISELTAGSMTVRLGPHHADPYVEVQWTRAMRADQLSELEAYRQRHTEPQEQPPIWLAPNASSPPPSRTATLAPHPRGFGLRAGVLLLAAALLTPMGSTLGMVVALAAAHAAKANVGWAVTGGSAVYPVAVLVLALALTVRAGRPTPTRLVMGAAELTVQAPSLTGSIDVPWIEVMEVETLRDRLRLYLAPQTLLPDHDNLGRGVVDFGYGTDATQRNEVAVGLRERIAWHRTNVLPASPARSAPQRKQTLEPGYAQPHLIALHPIPSIGTPVPSAPRQDLPPSTFLDDD